MFVAFLSFAVVIRPLRAQVRQKPKAFSVLSRIVRSKSEGSGRWQADSPQRLGGWSRKVGLYLLYNFLVEAFQYEANVEIVRNSFPRCPLQTYNHCSKLHHKI